MVFLLTPGYRHILRKQKIGKVVSKLSALLVTMGFDVDHVIYAFRVSDYSRIVFIVPENPDARTENAIEALSRFLGGKRIEVVRVPYHNFVHAVKIIELKLKELLKEHAEIVVSLSGGLRILVIETLLAYLMLKSSEKRRVRIINIVEGTRDLIEIDIIKLKEHPELSSTERSVLDLIVQKGEVSLGEIVRELNIGRSTAYKALNKLIDLNLVERVERGRYRIAETLLI